MKQIAYTIGTLVTNQQQYAEMRRSFEVHGFGTEDCEFLHIDNASTIQEGTQTDAFRGLNKLLNDASGRLVIFCHQDVLLDTEGRDVLEERLDELTELDSHWAVAGNAGATASGRGVRRITDKHGIDQHVGQLPERVVSLDENFIVIRNETRIGFSRNLTGFHMYGTDLCLIASIMGYNAYVIDFHLIHLGEGKKGPSFEVCETAFRRKWNTALRERYLQTPSTALLVTGSKVPSPITLLREKLHYMRARLRRSLSKRLPNRAKAPPR